MATSQSDIRVQHRLTHRRRAEPAQTVQAVGPGTFESLGQRAMGAISTRKDEHLDIVLSGKAAGRGPAHPFDRYRFVNEAAPVLRKADISLETPFLGKTVRAPLLISAMTGGPRRAETINVALAEAAEAAGIAMAVGSQRVAIEEAADGGLAKALRRAAPTIPLLSNIGAAQVALWSSPAPALRAIEMIEADALIVHFNPLQEALQPEGDTDWRNLWVALERLVAAAPVPLVAKEVGCGIGAATARRLTDIGFAAIDVAGTGGTSWAAVEAARGASHAEQAMAAPFHDWGIPTPEAIIDVRAALPDIPIIASGGIRHGIDAAMAIRLGANLVGQAANLLEPALRGPDAVTQALSTTTEQLRIVCFCTGAADLEALRLADLKTGP
jgi:isopentenyl-diphosphate delta-isomerase